MKRVGERRLTWRERFWYGVLFGLLVLALFSLEVR